MIVEPELLILDDALSAVDAKTEEAILSNLKRNAPRKTTIITAHRLSSVMHAKEILVLDEGKLLNGDASRVTGSEGLVSADVGKTAIRSEN